MIIEVEVDTLQQLDEVLAAAPDLVLLDNLRPAELRQAVARRNAVARPSNWRPPAASTWKASAAMAESGVERISVGALTHSAVALDIGLDWLSAGRRRRGRMCFCRCRVGQAKRSPTIICSPVLVGLRSLVPPYECPLILPAAGARSKSSRRSGSGLRLG